MTERRNLGTQRDFWHREVQVIDLAWWIPALAAGVLLAIDVANGQAVGPSGLMGAVMAVVASVAWLYSRMDRRDRDRPSEPGDTGQAQHLVDDVEDILRRRDDDR